MQNAGSADCDNLLKTIAGPVAVADADLHSTMAKTTCPLFDEHTGATNTIHYTAQHDVQLQQGMLSTATC